MNRSIRKPLCIFIIILLISVLSTNVNAEIQSFPGIPPKMYYWDSSLFSTKQDAKLGLYNVWNQQSVATVYNKTYEKNAKIEPSVGYAYYISKKLNKYDNRKIQKIIWSCEQWNNKSDLLYKYLGEKTSNDPDNIAYRSYQYGTVYYGILKDAIDNNKNIFKSNISNDNVRVFVDQDKKEYTIGPYSISLNVKENSYTPEAALYLYNEITKYTYSKNTAGYTNETAFAEFNEIKGLNQKEGTTSYFINQEGKKIEFPDFVSGEKFFIRFTPDKEGAISETGTPIISTKYMAGFNTSGNLIKYTPVAVQATGELGAAEKESASFTNTNDEGSNNNFETVSNTATNQYGGYNQPPSPATSEQQRKAQEQYMGIPTVEEQGGNYNEEMKERIEPAAEAIWEGIEATASSATIIMMIGGAIMGGGAALGTVGEGIVALGGTYVITSLGVTAISELVGTGVDSVYSLATTERLPKDIREKIEGISAVVYGGFSGTKVPALFTSDRIDDLFKMFGIEISNKSVENALSAFLEKYAPKGVHDFISYLEEKKKEELKDNVLTGLIDEVSHGYNYTYTEIEKYFERLMDKENGYGVDADDLSDWADFLKDGNTVTPKMLAALVIEVPDSQVQEESKTVEKSTQGEVTTVPVDTGTVDINNNTIIEQYPAFADFEVEMKGKTNDSFTVSIPVANGEEITVSLKDVPVKRKITIENIKNDAQYPNDPQYDVEGEAKKDKSVWYIDEDDTTEITITKPSFTHKVKEGEIEYSTVVDMKNEYSKIASNDEYIISPGIKIENNSVIPSTKNNDLKLGGAKINMQIGGIAWTDLNVDGKMNSNEIEYIGEQVELFEVGNSSPIATTITDKQGRYAFYGLTEKGTTLINPLKKYYIRFTYNGQLYQSTYYKSDVNINYSNAKDINRENYNNIFKEINSDPRGYFKDNRWKKAYSFGEKIKDDNGDYIKLKETQEEANTLTFAMVYYKFLNLAKFDNIVNISDDNATKKYDRNRNYEWVLEGKNNKNSLRNWLNSIGVNNDADNIIQFIKDSNIYATTNQDKKVYPENNQFLINSVDAGIETYWNKNTVSVKLDKDFKYLYSNNSDISKYVMHGTTSRNISNLVLQKDLYKIEMTENGKNEIYIYNYKKGFIKDSYLSYYKGINDITNGNMRYKRSIRKSDYLFSDLDKNKNLQVKATYRIQIMNLGNTNATVNEIIDYYDSNTYEFDGTLDGNQYTINKYNNYDENGNITSEYVNSYIGSDNFGNKLNDSLNVKIVGEKNRTRESLKGKNYKYDMLYLTGIKSHDGDDILVPGESSYVYLTFKVKNDLNTGKIMLDENLTDGLQTVGKRNIAEINSYSTYYNKGTTIPNYLDKNDKTINKKISNWNTPAGIVDFNSTPGNLREWDLDEKGNIKLGYTGKIDENENRILDASLDRQEDDTDKAPNLKLIIDQDDDNTRRMEGYTFEDNRTELVGNSVIGNGTYDENETKINGVTVQLVELIADVDENGLFKGTYSGERVWGTYNYGEDLKNQVNAIYKRYASGEGSSRVILNGPYNTILHVDEESTENGQYMFKSLPPGDFYVKFIYGDHNDTVLTNENNEVNNLINDKGKNAKSYNGQDYKSTIYQKNIDQNNLNYNGIEGYTKYDLQNYSSSDGATRNNGKDKSSMYDYDISRSDGQSNVSDAKDVDYYRQKTNNYSKGADGKTLKNNRAEILSSFERLSTYKPYEYNNGQVIYEDNKPKIDYEKQKENQISLIDELKENTKIESQTGIINTEIEYNREVTIDENSNYIIHNINLGLVERPKSQLTLNNEVTNISLTLANGNELFNTSKSERNLYYAKHQRSTTNYIKKLRNMLIESVEINTKNNKGTPELIQAYVDDELLAGATLKANYKISVENTGEVDYKDKKFYYTGIEDHPDDIDNIVKTNVGKVIDYVTNNIRFNRVEQQQWKIENMENLIPSTTLNKNEEPTIEENKIDEDYINRMYAEEANTYNILITSDSLQGELVPKINNNGISSKETFLTLSNILSNTYNNNMIVNNLAEIIESSNEVGRRNNYSVPGDEEMADQDLGNDAANYAISQVDRIKPAGIDADSSQKVVLMPPTGVNNKHQNIMMILTFIMAILAMTSIIVVKKHNNKVMNEKDINNEK